MSTDDPARRRARVAAVAGAPAVLAASLAAHPFIEGRLPDEAAIAEKVTADTTMWAVVHLAAAVSSALMIIAFLAVRSYLRDAGEDRLSAPGVPLVVLGSTLFAVLPGIEFVPLAVAETGASTARVAEAQAAVVNWFQLVLLVGAIAFAAGVLLFAGALSSARVLPAGLTFLVAGALVVLALTRFVPLSVAQFYLQGVAALVALWPVAYVMWTQPVPRARPGTALGAASPV